MVDVSLIIKKKKTQWIFSQNQSWKKNYCENFFLLKKQKKSQNFHFLFEYSLFFFRFQREKKYSS